MIDLATPASPLRFDAILDEAPRSRPPMTGIRRFGRIVRDYATPSRSFAVAAAIYLLLCALAFFVVRPTTLLYFADYWEHRTIVDEIARHGLQLHDPIYGEQASSRQFTPWSLALGFAARLGHLDSNTVMAWGAMLVSVLFVIGVHRFARTYFRHRWAPTLLLVVLTCGWGVPPLIWTGFYAFRSQLHGNYYPAALVFALTFVAWASAVRLLRGDRPALSDVVLLGVVIAFSVITHPLNAAFLVAGVAGFVVLEPGVTLARRACVALTICVGIAATIFWPYFNPLSLVGAGMARGQATFNNFSFFFNPLFVVAMAWPAIFATLGLTGLWRDSELRMPVLALALIFLAYAVGGIADISVSHRLLAYVILMLHLILVRALLDTIDGRPPKSWDVLTPRAWQGLSIVVALLVVMQTAMAVEQLVQPWANTHYPYPIHQVDADTSKVVAALPADSRVLGWDSAALVMPSHGVLVASFPRPMPLSPSDSARQADYRRFFEPVASTCERLAIAHRWRATHIAYLTNELDGRVQRELKRFGPATSPLAPWRIIKVPGRETSGC